MLFNNIDNVLSDITSDDDLWWSIQVNSIFFCFISNNIETNLSFVFSETDKSTINTTSFSLKSEIKHEYISINKARIVSPILEIKVKIESENKEYIFCKEYDDFDEHYVYVCENP